MSIRCAKFVDQRQSSLRQFVQSFHYSTFSQILTLTTFGPFTPIKNIVYKLLRFGTDRYILHGVKKRLLILRRKTIEGLSHAFIIEQGDPGA